jgi:hypothetical protein
VCYPERVEGLAGQAVSLVQAVVRFDVEGRPISRTPLRHADIDSFIDAVSRRISPLDDFVEILTTLCKNPAVLSEAVTRQLKVRRVLAGIFGTFDLVADIAQLGAKERSHVIDRFSC